MRFKYHFALSFSGACRREARALAERLRDSGYGVFFDEWYEHEMLGLSGTEYLRQVYGKDSQHCIVLIDQTYDQRQWTLFEREIIEARTLQEPKDVLIPVLVDGHRPAWLPQSRIYCDYREKGLEGTVALMIRKLPLDYGGVPVSFAPTREFEHDLVISRKGRAEGPRVLIINAGGTIGLFSEEQFRTGKPARWHDLQSLMPELDRLGFGIDMVTFFPHIDAANVSHGHWSAIANAIAVHYEEYVGFVILHGSDTLAYTASALSFILANLAKPVVLTYSLLLPFNKDTDATANILGALSVAGGVATGLTLVPEVCILSQDVLLRGNRCTTRSALGSLAFGSPSFPPLGSIGANVRINADVVQPLPTEDFYIDSALSFGVVLLTLHPGMSLDLMRRVVFGHDQEESSVTGVLLDVYETGSYPQNSDLRAFISRCGAQRLPVVMMSRQKDRSANHLGAIGTLDMTREAALCKLIWAVGHKVPYEDIGAVITKDFRGELTEKPAISKLCEVKQDES